MKNRGFHRWAYGLVLALGRGSLTQDQWYGGAPIAKFHNKDRREGFALDGSFDSWFVRLPNLIAFSFMCESFYKCRVGQRALIQSNDTPVFQHGAESVWVILLTSYGCGHITIISLPKSVRVNKAPYSIRYSSLNVLGRWWLCSQQLSWRYVVLITFQFTYQCTETVKLS